jgi:hypothetical protein
MVKVLITDPLLRKTFDIVNIILTKINKESLLFLCCCPRELKKAKKIYKGSTILQVSVDQFSRDLYTLSKKYANDKIIYMPIEEASTLKFYDFIKVYGDQNFLFKLPSSDSFHLSRNKDELNKFCERQKVPCPKFYSEEDLDKGQFKLPVIVKPINGSGSNGIKFIKKLSECEFINFNFRVYFAQELVRSFKGVEAGFFLCSEGKVISFYSHERIRTYPKQGGVSVFSKLTYNAEVLDAGSIIIEKLNWTGFIMIEFMKCKQARQYKLIEINPRLWGSILLSECGGTSFIFKYIALCNGEEIENKISKNCKYIRWIFPYDFLYFLRNPQNPFKFFKKEKNTCYINFTYTSFLRSVYFIVTTYFDREKIKKKINERKKGSNCF